MKDEKAIEFLLGSIQHPKRGYIDTVKQKSAYCYNPDDVIQWMFPTKQKSRSGAGKDAPVLTQDCLARMASDEKLHQQLQTILLNNLDWKLSTSFGLTLSNPCPHSYDIIDIIKTDKFDIKFTKSLSAKSIPEFKKVSRIMASLSEFDLANIADLLITKLKALNAERPKNQQIADSVIDKWSQKLPDLYSLRPAPGLYPVIGNVYQNNPVPPFTLITQSNQVAISSLNCTLFQNMLSTPAQNKLPPPLQPTQQLPTPTAPPLSTVEEPSLLEQLYNLPSPPKNLPQDQTHESKDKLMMFAK